ncbi:hypothetical protein ACFP3T_01430 [Lactiplantibacillus dongliensis]|uniref:D-alanyl-D-alanine carboxypeptidase n=1 Tax=Lactiplantibacillus dongliensis TaxID=2559919 RepID=A0ABW1R556_9LACO|nr:hypothetical protein [Lactiplantibacillus dongliensis]
MKLGKVLLLTAAVLGAAGSLSVTDVQAKTGYQRTKNLAVKPKAFYSTSKHGATYQANGSLTNFKFKKNHALTHYRDSTWVATSKTYIKMHGKHRLYYYVHNSDGKAKGWVWSGYLKAGKHNQMRHEESKQVGNYVMAKPGKLYQFGGGYRTKGFNPFNIRFKHGIKLSDKVTYKRTQLWTVYKHGKASKYYYVTSSDNQVKGWVWHGFLKPGEVKEAAKKPAPAVTKPSGGTSNNQSNIGGVVVNSKPTTPDQKPNLENWTTDDGKRERVVVDYFELTNYLNKGGSYNNAVSVVMESKFVNGKYIKQRQTLTNITSELVGNDAYSMHRQIFATIDGKKTPVNGYLKDPILLNGDAIYNDSDDDYFVSVREPERFKHYDIDQQDAYITEVPVWYQYSVQDNDYSVWRFNLKTNQWDKTQSHVADVVIH